MGIEPYWEDVKINGGSLVNLDLRDMWMLGCEFKGSTFDQCVFPANATALRLVDGKAVNSHLVKCDLTHAQIDIFQFEDSDLIRADLFQSILSEVQFIRCDLLKVNFSQVRMRNVLFERCSFDRTLFTQAELVNVRIVDPIIVERVVTDGTSATSDSPSNDPLQVLRQDRC
jgi:uncharacterized protein YjbI with pentapeptide repeats